MLLILQMRRRTLQECESLLKVIWVVKNGTRVQTLVWVQALCLSPMTTPDTHTSCFLDSLPVSGLQRTSFSGREEVVGEVVSGILVGQTSWMPSKPHLREPPNNLTLTFIVFIGIPHLRGPEIHPRWCYRWGIDNPQSCKQRSQAQPGTMVLTIVWACSPLGEAPSPCSWFGWKRSEPPICGRWGKSLN